MKKTNPKPLQFIERDPLHNLRLGLGHIEEALEALDNNRLPVVYLSGGGTSVTLRFECAGGPGHDRPWLALLKVLQGFAQGQGYIAAQTCPADWESRITPKSPSIPDMIADLESQPKFLGQI